MFQQQYESVNNLNTNLIIITIRPHYPDIWFSCYSAYHVRFSKSRFLVYDFSANELQILHH